MIQTLVTISFSRIHRVAHLIVALIAVVVSNCSQVKGFVGNGPSILLQRSFIRGRALAYYGDCLIQRASSSTPKSESNHTPNQPPKAKKKQKKQKNSTNNSVNNIISKIGLTPVSKVKTKTNSKSSSLQQQQQQQQRCPLISLQTQLSYARNGHAVLRRWVKPDKLVPIRHALLKYGHENEIKAWRQKVEVAAGPKLAADCNTLKECEDALQELGIASDSLPFLQYFNTWRSISCVYDMALELAETAAILLDVPSVRLYQDSFFWKRAHDGPTPWHTDARMAPFDTSHLVTLWVPLHDIQASQHGGSALHFVSKSHADFALPFWNPYSSEGGDTSSKWEHLEERYQHNNIVHYMPLTMGDVTAHSGWTLHCADRQREHQHVSVEGDENHQNSRDRLALAISYVDARAPIRESVLRNDDHGDDEDQWSFRDWVNDVPRGKEFGGHPLVPIVWP